MSQTSYPPIALNRYLYANGDPITLVDPRGRGALSEYAGEIYLAAFLATLVVIDERFPTELSDTGSICGAFGSLAGIAAAAPFVLVGVATTIPLSLWALSGAVGCLWAGIAAGGI